MPQLVRFGVVDDACSECGVDGRYIRFAHTCSEWLAGRDEHERLFQVENAVALSAFIDTGRESFADGARLHREFGNRPGQFIRGTVFMSAERECDGAHEQAERTRWIVAEHFVETAFDRAESGLAGPVNDRQVLGELVFGMESLEHAAQKIQFAQHVTEPRGDHLATFQRAAEMQEHDLGDEREGCRVA